MAFKSGFVAIVGRPNAGKSTLVNTIVGRKVAIVSPRPQTTRNRIQGILNRDDAQVVLIDTPGIHKPDNLLGRQMMGEAEHALECVDVVSLIVDVTVEFGAGASTISRAGVSPPQQSGSRKKANAAAVDRALAARIRVCRNFPDFRADRRRLRGRGGKLD